LYLLSVQVTYEWDAIEHETRLAGFFLMDVPLDKIIQISPHGVRYLYAYCE